MRTSRFTVVGRLAVISAALIIVSSCENSPPPPPPKPSPLANLHYKCYSIPPAESRYTKPITLVTQFPKEVVTLGRPLSLCAPVIKNGHGTLDATDLKCYAIVGDEAKARVKLESEQFGTETLDVGAAIALCTPANKTEFPKEPPQSLVRDPHYKCYALLGGKPPHAGPVTLKTTQFPLEKKVAVGTPQALCLPALKNPPQDKDKQKSDLDRLQSVFPHLKCYGIQGPPPGNVVNMRTQFGLERKVTVGGPQGLCVPVKKTVLEHGKG